MDFHLVDIKTVKKNPNNPRIIKDDKFLKLVNSIKEFPKMLEIRPIVVNADMIVLGGNMRLKACIEAGLKEVPIIKANDLTEDEQRQFIIKDNVSGGEWDWEMLSNEWDTEQLEDWGLDVPDFEVETDYSEKNKEIDVDDYEDTMTLVLKFSEDDYHLVKDKLLHLATTPEQAIFKLLGLTETENE